VRFLVTRTSEWDETVSPCPEAIPTQRRCWDHRTFKSPKEYDAKFGGERRGPWLSEGSEHRIDRGPRGGAQGISRMLRTEQAWAIDLPSLDDLLAFVNKYGEVVIGNEWPEDGNPPTVEIYDGWRE